MSGLRHPVGAQDPRVYWVRRFVVVALAVVVVTSLVVVVRTLAGGSGGNAAPPVTPVSVASTQSGSSASPTPSAPVPSSGSSSGSPSVATGSVSAPATSSLSSTVPSTSTSSGTATVGATGNSLPAACTAAQLQIDLVPATRRISQGTSLTSQLVVHSTTTGCVAHIDPWSLSITVMSGSDRVWTSKQCTGTVPRRTVWVSRTIGDHFPVTWNGHRSSSECPTLPVVTAQPGTYTISATLGASTSPHRVFTII